MSDKKQAEIACKALIVNDLEDLSDVKLELVVGFPNIKYAGVASPLRPGLQLSGFLAQIRSLGQNRFAGANDFLSNSLGQQAQYNQFQTSVFNVPTDADGSSIEDMFFYDAGMLTLKKGQRRYLPIFATQCDYKHVYEWEIIDYVDDNSRFRRLGQQQPDTVWHSLSLLNTTPHPWTTAAAMVVKDGRPLSQDTISYTVPGGTAKVRITKALGVRPSTNEYQVDRPSGRETERIWGQNFEVVTVHGEIEAKNTMKKEISMEITKYLSGDIEKIDGEPLVETITAGLSRINPSRKVLWCPTIKAGETWRVEYEYKVLIRR